MSERLGFLSILAEGGLRFGHLTDQYRQTLDFLENYRYRDDVFVETQARQMTVGCVLMLMTMSVGVMASLSTLTLTHIFD